jgi:hypothetical protein
MINSYAIKEVTSNGTVVEYFDDRNISITLNLIPPFNADQSAMTEDQLRTEIIRHTIYLAPQMDAKFTSIEWIQTPIPLMEKQLVSMQDLQAVITAEDERTKKFTQISVGKLPTYTQA